MSKRQRAARSTKHQRPARPASVASRAPSSPQVGSGTSVAEASPAAVMTAPAGTANGAEAKAAPVRLQSRGGARPSGLLAARAANEYVYVAQDLRRIGTFAAAVAVIMIVVWVLVDLAQVIKL
jgi:hypothetical protein